MWNLHRFSLFKRRLCLYQGILLLTIQMPCFGWNLFSDPEQKYQHLMPSGSAFPGSVPKEAERINKTILFSLHPRNFSALRLDIPPKNLKSTGLYCVQGEPVTIQIQPMAGNALNPQLYLGVGVHTRIDSIPEAKRKRPDLVAYSIPLNTTTFLTRKCYFSGLLYLESYEEGTDSFEVTLSGAVKAPWFKLGRDSLEEWRNEIRHYPAPWAELEGQHTILTLPSAMVRDLDDPVPVIIAYDQLVRDVNALAGLSPDANEIINKAPDLPFRFVLDIQTQYNTVSHAGYPIILYWLHYGSPFLFIDPNTIRSGQLVRHELGHSYEPLDEAFEPPGAAQAFANFFTYGYQYQSGYWFISDPWHPDFCYYYIPILEYYWDFGVYALYGAYDSTIWNQDYTVMESKKSAFMIALVTRLTTEPITKLYRHFRRLPEEQIPTSPQEKTDYFFESLCKFTGQDLTLLFRHWRVPVSPAAYQRVYQEQYGHPRWLYHDGL